MSYIYYISNINPFIWNDKSTADPAYYEDFTTIYNKYFKVDKCSIKEGYDFAIKCLKEYNEVEMKRYGSNIEEVINVFFQCSFKEWKKITNNKEC